MNVNWFVLLMGFIVGLVIVYFTFPEPKIVIKYPTIDNIGSTTYVDEKGLCYKYFAKEITCK